MSNKPKISEQKRLSKLKSAPITEAIHGAGEAPLHPADNNMATEKQRDLVLTHKEALAGSPDDIAVCGEEDVGAGLEFLVTRDDHHK